MILFRSILTAEVSTNMLTRYIPVFYQPRFIMANVDFKIGAFRRAIVDYLSTVSSVNVNVDNLSNTTSDNVEHSSTDVSASIPDIMAPPLQRVVPSVSPFNNYLTHTVINYILH